MLKHNHIWSALDRLAREHGLSVSGLARRAGLDPTTFNKSKRTTRDGKLRWPSTESLAKVLNSTGTTIGEFVVFIGEEDAGGVYRNVPLIGLAQAGNEGCFDDSGYPVGGTWDEVPFPDIGDPHAYALEISGDGMAPVYRDGDVIVVAPSANIRRGDRVVIKTRDGEVMVKELRRRSARKIDLQSLNPEYPDRTLEFDDLMWLGRVIWASQ